MQIEDFEEKVDLFLKNKLSEQEKEEFLSLLKENPELKERAKAIAILVKEMKEISREKTQEFSGQISKMSEEEFLKKASAKVKEPALEKPVIPFMRWKWQYVTAACLVIFLGFVGLKFYLERDYINQIAMEQQFITFDANSRGTQEFDFEAINNIINQISNNKNLKENTAKLEEFFNNQDYFMYQNQFAWNLAIAYLKQHKEEKSLEKLDFILQNNEPGKAIYKQALALKEKIK